MADNSAQRRAARRRLLQSIDINGDFNILDWYWDTESPTGPDLTRSAAPVAAALGIAVECFNTLHWKTRATPDLSRLMDLSLERDMWRPGIDPAERTRIRNKVLADFLLEQGA